MYVRGLKGTWTMAYRGIWGNRATFRVPFFAAATTAAAFVDVDVLAVAFNCYTQFAVMSAALRALKFDPKFRL